MEKAYSLLIIKSTARALEPAEEILKRHGWNLISTTEIDEAISIMLKHQPQFVMISVDHPSRKLMAFRQVIQQSFSCCVIMFAEYLDTQSYKRLANSKTEYLVYPPVTGPAIERTINKYHKDQADTQTLANSLLPKVESLKISGLKQQLEKLAIESLSSEIVEPSFVMAPEHDFAGDETLIPTRNHKDTPILRGSRDAFESSLSNTSHRATAKTTLQEVNQAACFSVKSHYQSGYLVIATSGDKEVDSNLVSMIREKLLAFLSNNGEDAVSEEGLSLNLNSVPFDEWAIEKAEFLRKGIHEDNEIALAYFPRKDVHCQLDSSSQDNMLTISLVELTPDTAVEFDLYLYLPANQKYILYTPKGAVLYSRQKEKLTRQGVSQMHFLARESENFKAYRVQNFLNKNIDTYKEEARITALNMLSSN